MHPACNTAHHSALGERHQRHTVCGLQAAADSLPVRSARFRLGGLVPAFGRSLVACWRPVRPCPSVLSGESLGDGGHVAQGLRAPQRVAGAASPARSAKARQATAPAGQVTSWAPCARMRQCARHEAARSSVAGGMGAAVPHVDAMPASRPCVSREAMSTPLQRFLRALLARPVRSTATPIERSESGSSGSYVTPGQSLMGESV
jgi:hypothetical protein